MKLALLGYGRMGRAVELAAKESGHEIGAILDLPENDGGAAITAEALDGTDAAIDFSEPGAVLANIEATARLGVPLVVGTTGWHDHFDDVRLLVEERGATLVYGANFSVGANLFFLLAERAAELFDRFDDYDPYILDRHHRHKLDAPSGTALRLAEGVLGAMGRKQRIETGNPEGAIAPEALHVASLRAGSIPGEHRVGFDGPSDSVQLVHNARGREGFARGAVIAAEWVVGKTGLYEFSQVMEDLLRGSA